MTVDDLLRDAAADLHADVRATLDAPAALRLVVERRPPRRRPPLLAAAVVLVAVAAAAAAVVVVATGDDGEPVSSGPSTPVVVGGPDPGEAVGLEMTVRPATDLASGDRVRVTAEGLPGPDVSLALCRADALEQGAAGAEGCDLELGSDSRIGADGDLGASVTVKRQLALLDGSSLDCAVAGARCAIGIVLETPEGEPAGPGEGTAMRRELLGLAGVRFAPAEPDPVPVLAISPVEGLHHGDTVTLEGEGFRGSVGHVSLCEDAENGSCTIIPLGSSAGAELRTDDEGRFRADVPVWRVFPANPTPGDAVLVDCADRGCTLAVIDGVGRGSAPVAVAFADDEPAPEPPTLAVTPTTGLRPGDPVTVTVRGLPAGEEAQVAGCSTRPEAPGLPCAQSEGLETIVGDDDGVVTVVVEAVDPASDGVDCTVPGTCAIALTSPRSMVEGDPLVRAAVPVPLQYAP